MSNPPVALKSPGLGSCARCGSPIAELGAHFCNRCGAPVMVPPANAPDRRRVRIALVVALFLLGLVAAVVAVLVLAPDPTRPAGTARATEPSRPGTTTSSVPAPPTAEVDASTVLRATIDAAGATLPLAGGMTLVFPPGAVEQPTAVSFRFLDRSSPKLAGAPPGLAFEGTSAQPRFARPVELVIPLPPEITDDQAASATIGTFEGGALVIESPVRVESVGGRRVLVMPMDHFSVHIVVIGGGVLVIGAIRAASVAFYAIKGWWWAPPTSVVPMLVPIYHQGPGKDCVVASITMLARAIKPDAEESWRFMEGAHLQPGGILAIPIIGDRGLSPLAQRLTSGVSNETKRVLGVEPEIRLWHLLVALDTGPLLGELKRYIRQHLAAGHPVVFSSTAMDTHDGGDSNHAMLLVGYDANGYWAANPQDSTSSCGLREFVVNRDCALRRFTEAELGISWTVIQAYATMVVPTALDPARPTLSVNFPPASVSFRTLTGTHYELGWDGLRRGGIRWTKHLAAGQGGTPVDVVPGDATRLDLEKIEVINAEASTRTATVTLEIFNVTKGSTPVVLDGNETALRQTITIPGGARYRLGFMIDTMKLRPPTVTTVQQFKIKATVDGGGTPDTATFEVSLAPDTSLALIGVWEGEAFGGSPMTLTIASQTGNNFTGTFAMQGQSLGMEGTWRAATSSWTLELWETSSPRFKFPAPGSLLPHSGGRLRLTAPGSLFVKQGSARGSADDDPYDVVQDYLEHLPAK